MPRVSINADKYRQFDTSQLIQSYQVRAKKTQQDMADILGITQPAYRKKLLNVNFTLKDIQRMYKPLELSAEEILWLVTGKEQL